MRAKPKSDVPARSDGQKTRSDGMLRAPRLRQEGSRPRDGVPAVVEDMQLLLSLPLTPVTYHVVADATEVRARRKTIRSRPLGLDAGNPSGCTDGLGHLLKTDQ